MQFRGDFSLLLLLSSFDTFLGSLDAVEFILGGRHVESSVFGVIQGGEPEGQASGGASFEVHGLDVIPAAERDLLAELAKHVDEIFLGLFCRMPAQIGTLDRQTAPTADA